MENIENSTATLRDTDCIILKKREYDDLVNAADKGIMLHIGVFPIVIIMMLILRHIKIVLLSVLIR